MRLERLWCGVVVGVSALLVAGCGSDALTTQPSVNPPRQTGAPAVQSPSDALTSAVTKLRLIAQDSCQTAPVGQVYPNCDRFLAELRSAAGTIHNNAPEVPGGAPIASTSAGILTSAGAYEKDGCGGGPDGADAGSAQACTADLTKVRQGVSALLSQTSSVHS